MKDIHNNLIFHLHNPRKDGEGIDLVIYRFDDNAKRCYTINEVNKYIKEGQDLNKSEKNYNSETIDGLNEVRAKYKTMLEQNPDSPKIHKILKATADIIRHFQEWFDDNEIEFPANYTPNIYLKDFKYMDDYYRVWILEYEILNMEYEIWNMKCGIWNIKYGIWNMEYDIWTVEYGIWNMEYGI